MTSSLPGSSTGEKLFHHPRRLACGVSFAMNSNGRGKRVPESRLSLSFGLQY